MVRRILTPALGAALAFVSPGNYAEAAWFDPNPAVYTAPGNLVRAVQDRVSESNNHRQQAVLEARRQWLNRQIADYNRAVESYYAQYYDITLTTNCADPLFGSSIYRPDLQPGFHPPQAEYRCNEPLQGPVLNLPPAPAATPTDSGGTRSILIKRH